MGTRGFVGFVVDGTEKIAYNHFDSYPSGLGVDVLSWLRKEHLGYIRRKAAELQVVDGETAPTPDQIERLAAYADRGVSTGQLDEWYVLLRETQGNPAAILDAGFLIDGKDFPRDSLYAEYGYLVDLDANTFEAYRGFQKEPHDKGRFAGREREQYSSGAEYWPCALVASWPLDALPTDEQLLAAFGHGEE